VYGQQRKAATTGKIFIINVAPLFYLPSHSPPSSPPSSLTFPSNIAIFQAHSLGFGRHRSIAIIVSSSCVRYPRKPRSTLACTWNTLIATTIVAPALARFLAQPSTQTTGSPHFANYFTPRPRITCLPQLRSSTFPVSRNSPFYIAACLPACVYTLFVMAIARVRSQRGGSKLLRV